MPDKAKPAAVRKAFLLRINPQVMAAVERLAAADDVLDNNGTPEQLRAAVDALWTRWHQPA